ncbi:hypothetical protein D8674_032007 [Pyrus ussuriensis x Pyrus communis]|uniref:Nucleotide-diphospho-sugar transferase domain-containing protein n=1 Tax=Pyrus ussuriensis x Pyrus communis TaxID=2448454 RepID=A0A5N5F0S9_9ROSA|nr:hypothetical protein D8674_032007 [Pyrus ussuriensis x Pyrus communis]
MESRHATILCLLFAGLVLVFIFNQTSYGSIPLFVFQSSQYCNPSTQSNTRNYTDALESALSEVSMANKTVIIAIVNKAYVEGDKPMLDLFLDGFWLGEDTRGLISHLLLVAVDQTSFERCRFLHLHCYKLEADDHANFEAEKLYMSQEFIKMMWRRTLFLKDLLKRGYSFVFTDIDVMWLRNPFPRLNSFNESMDLQISADKFNGDQWSESNPINTGFYMVRSNNRTISLFEKWYDRKNNSTGVKEQDVLDSMMHEGVFRELGLSVKFLDTLYFSGFCEVSKDFKAVTTIHANCCRTISAKVADLTAVIHDWKKFEILSNSSQTSSLKWTNHVNCQGSWKDFNVTLG